MYNITEMTTDNGSTHDHYENVGLHPGITTIISFCVAIVLVFAYLYYESVIGCFRNYFSGHQNNEILDAEEGVSKTVKRPRNDPSKNGAAVGESRKNSIEEPGILCQCGKIHILRDCFKESELNEYKNLFAKLDDGNRNDHAIEEVKESSKESRKTSFCTEDSPKFSTTPLIKEQRAVVPLIHVENETCFKTKKPEVGVS